MREEVPHEEIRATRDRGWSMRLLRAILDQDGPEEELDRFVETLRELEDSRVIEPLRAVLFDVARDPWLRDAASSVLIASDDAVTDAELRAWWRSEDDLIREHALYSMGRGQADIVLAVAGDDAHPLQAAAFLPMTVGFDDAESAAIAMRALRHADPDVRETAAKYMLWDEPVAAEGLLLELVEDAEEAVALEAVRALAYYTSRRVLRRLSELADRVGGDVSEAVAAALGNLVDDFETSVAEGHDPVAITRLRTWMAPVADLVSWPDAIEPPPARTWTPPAPVVRKPVAEVLAEVANQDVSSRSAYRAQQSTDWTAFSRPEREEISARMMSHPQAAVRRRAPEILAVWGDHDGLVRLARDPSLDVRRAAMEVIRELPAHAAYAGVSWEVAQESSGLQRGSGISAYGRHAPPAEAIPRLLEIARDDPYSDGRVYSIWALTELGARDALRELLPLLNEPPFVNWGTHLALLRAVIELELPAPDLAAVAEIDDLEIAVALAQIGLDQTVTG